MQNLIHTLTIENFKSIRSLQINCKRINVFVGLPNVGKSNILEALALMGLTEPHVPGGLRDLVRFEMVDNLFYDNRKNEVCSVIANGFTCHLHYNAYINKYFWFLGDTERMQLVMPEVEQRLSQNIGADSVINFFQQSFLDADTLKHSINNPLLMPAFAQFDSPQASRSGIRNSYPSRIRKYIFPTNGSFDVSFNDYLLPVFGRNLFSVLERHEEVESLAAPLFESYGLRMMQDENKYVITKSIGNTLKKYPFALVAETLQRIIFYLAAIHTNRDAVLIFEEPETHLHAAYIRDLAGNIVDAAENQFFLATHSPYLLQHLMENASTDDLAVFAVSFDTQEYATKARALSAEEIQDIIGYGTDVFFNMERYIVSEAALNGVHKNDDVGVAA